MCFCLHDGRAFTPHGRAFERGRHSSEDETGQAAGDDHFFANIDQQAITGAKTSSGSKQEDLRALRRGTRKEQEGQAD